MTHHRKPETTTGQIKIVVKTFGHPVTAIQGRPAKQVVGIGILSLQLFRIVVISTWAGYCLGAHKKNKILNRFKI